MCFRTLASPTGGVPAPLPQWHFVALSSSDRFRVLPDAATEFRVMLRLLIFLLLSWQAASVVAAPASSAPAPVRRPASAPQAARPERSDQYALRPANDGQSRSSFGLKLRPGGALRDDDGGARDQPGYPGR